jgi:acetylornithine deacetylase/succinyl-diaminopimelate desuccinylase-like protein
MTMSEKAPADFVDQERLAATLIDLINIPSPTGGEQALAEYLRERFEQMGLRSWLQEVEPEESNVVGQLRGAGDGPILMFLGHLDTTWDGGEEGIRELGEAYQPIARRDGDWIYGMGAYNMKCGLATSIEAIQALLDAGVELRGDVIIAGVVGESPKAEIRRYKGGGFRGAGKGVRHLVNNGVLADLCVVPESTHGNISVESGGYVYVELSTLGHPGATYRRKGSDPEVDQENAIERMNLLIEKVREWGRQYVAELDRDGGMPVHCSVTSFEGGLAYRPSKQPPFCRATVEIGVRPGHSLTQVYAEVREVVRNSGVPTADVDLIQAVPGALVTEDEAVVRFLAAAHEREFGEKPALTSDGWLADTTHLTRYGIPSVCYSTAGRVRAGGSGYYAVDGEQCFVPDLARGARVFADLAFDLASKPREEVFEDRPKPAGTVIY